MSLQHIKEPTPQRTASGEEHGLVKVLANSVPFNEYKRFKEKDRPSMEKLHKDQSKMVKVMYINKKSNTERKEMVYNLWDGDPLLGYKFIPDHEYDVPLGLIHMVNKKKKQKRTGLVDKNNKALMQDIEESGDEMFVATGTF